VKVGIVVIGRNEGARLTRCLESALRGGVPVVYVDSASTDGSVDMARKLGVRTLALDMTVPFTAARARNAGFRELTKSRAGIEYVQFVDGDCELADGWLEKSAELLALDQSVAAVSGRLREKFPENSVYNLLCDIEWDGPTGEVKACGGIAMMRVSAMQTESGFREDLIAGEEPELCVRLRKSGWKIWRLPDDMATHDASMDRFGQWWTRSVRAGYAFAQGANLHGSRPERHGVRESRSAWFWGLGIPLVTLVGLAWIGSWGLLPLLAYPVQVARIALRGKRSPRENWWRAAFLVLGKFAEVTGQAKFLVDWVFGARRRPIEYK
jgi:GT2 family glycosyltransferase